MAQSEIDPYTFMGTVLPQRAELHLDFQLAFSHPTTEFDGRAHVSIIYNQLVVEVFSNQSWDIFDLRNVVLTLVEDELASIGFAIGHAYDVEITRVLRRSSGVDYVFGIDVPCISVPRKGRDLASTLHKLRQVRVGPLGMYINRCFNDLRLAMHRANDTAFHCYRAIESLRHHCAAQQDLPKDDRALQWQRFRSISAVDEEELRFLSDAARPLRHGQYLNVNGEDRGELLERTWGVVDRYIATL